MAIAEKDILNRLYIIAGCMFIVAIAICFNLFKIQFIDGDKYRELAEKNTVKIKELRKQAVEDILKKKTYPIAFKVDRNNATELQFKGYEGTLIDSKTTNGKRLFYDKSKSFVKPVKYYNNFIETKSIEIPKAYILQQGWHKIEERLKNNKITFSKFLNDTVINVEVNHIKDFKTRKMAYEGHYLHYNTSVNKSKKEFKFSKGDLLIPTNQQGARYLFETLEAEATDSFFNWNFFDTILQQKEGYSSYVFEDLAEEFLVQNPEIKKEFDDKIKNDEAFAKNPRAQLNFIYKKSAHYEPAHLRLPVFKLF